MINTMFDLHILTNNSPQGNDKVAFLCEKAVAKKLRAVAFCDHFDLDRFIADNGVRSIRHSYFDTAKAKLMFFGSILVLAGIETEQAVFNKDLHNRIITTQAYDIVLTSLHKLPGRKEFLELPRQSPDNDCVFCDYLDALAKTAEEIDFDVLSQILYPLRYIHIDTSVFPKEMSSLLSSLASHEKALEIDTRDIMGSERLRNFYLDVLCEFRKVGGKYITIGSEAYFNDDIGYGVDVAMSTAKRAGFSEITLFEKRVPYTFPL